MLVTMESKRYDPELVTARYVRSTQTEGVYRFCEVGTDRRYNTRRGLVDADEIPLGIRDAADAQMHQAFAYVPWPHNA